MNTIEPNLKFKLSKLPIKSSLESLDRFITKVRTFLRKFRDGFETHFDNYLTAVENRTLPLAPYLTFRKADSIYTKLISSLKKFESALREDYFTTASVVRELQSIRNKQLKLAAQKTDKNSAQIISKFNNTSKEFKQLAEDYRDNLSNFFQLQGSLDQMIIIYTSLSGKSFKIFMRNEYKDFLELLGLEEADGFAIKVSKAAESVKKFNDKLVEEFKKNIELLDESKLLEVIKPDILDLEAPESISRTGIGNSRPGTSSKNATFEPISNSASNSALNFELRPNSALNFEPRSNSASNFEPRSNSASNFEPNSKLRPNSASNSEASYQTEPNFSSNLNSASTSQPNSGFRPNSASNYDPNYQSKPSTSSQPSYNLLGDDDTERNEDRRRENRKRRLINLNTDQVPGVQQKKAKFELNTDDLISSITSTMLINSGIVEQNTPIPRVNFLLKEAKNEFKIWDNLWLDRFKNLTYYQEFIKDASDFMLPNPANSENLDVELMKVIDNLEKTHGELFKDGTMPSIIEILEINDAEKMEARNEFLKNWLKWTNMIHLYICFDINKTITDLDIFSENDEVVIKKWIFKLKIQNIVRYLYEQSVKKVENILEFPSDEIEEFRKALIDVYKQGVIQKMKLSIVKLEVKINPNVNLKTVIHQELETFFVFDIEISSIIRLKGILNSSGYPQIGTLVVSTRLGLQ
ncbi:hypothetical protein KQX54_011284 [Cotesia glomerata]|uniref:Uncharacterized protein n=1 Tax=Cotesia glomerata TaxID=32391 RepID=A0AAV7I7D7_COTGL|nr:hypothetical protein KQX54_011284 [Cotesia glomerata]